jgi:hypothetical protein
MSIVFEPLIYISKNCFNIHMEFHKVMMGTKYAPVQYSTVPDTSIEKAGALLQLDSPISHCHIVHDE